jgi:hypothetical protein
MLEYQRQTDTTNRIELTSTIEHAVWDRAVGSIGEEVGFQVYTHFVGNYNEVEIEFHNGNGRRLDRITVSTYGNKCGGTFTIPERVNDFIYYDVRIRNLGLRCRSEDLVLVPPRTITNPRWSQTEARRGDILTLSADVDEVRDGTRARIQIYEHDDDGAHDLITELHGLVESRRIEVEWEYEYHEDTDEIPTESELEKGYNPPEYFFRVSIDSISADSELLTFKDWIEVEVRDEAGQLAADQDYILHLPDDSTRNGTTNERGIAREEDVPPGPWWIELINDSG